MNSEIDKVNCCECTFEVKNETDESLNKIIGLGIFLLGLIISIISYNFITFDLTAIRTPLFFIFLSGFIMTSISFLYLMIEH